jgi:allophanate hydrolase
MTPQSPVAAAEAALDADRAYADPAIWISRVPDAAVLARARALEAEGPQGRKLWGVPFAVKDNLDVAGLPTTSACPSYAYTPAKDAPVVRRLLDAGAVLLGKTNLDQFATGLVGVRSPYGVPRNPFDAARVPGGSSSGSGVAVAAGIVPFALGTDTAGSGRVPAAFGNIVGLKPTIGSFSSCGMVPACKSIDTVSVFARSVDEALAVARIAAGFDAADPYARAAPFDHLRRGPAPPHARIRVARLEGTGCTEAVAGATARVAELLGAVETDIAPFLNIACLLYDGPWVAERSAVFEEFLAAQLDAFHPTTRAIFQGGLDRRATDAFRAFHQLASVRQQARALFAECDALLVPTAPFCPTLAELEVDPIGPNSRLGTFTNFVNLCDLAAIAVPAGFGPDGLPVGVTLLGPAWSEGRLAALADLIHRAFSSVVGATGQPLPPAAPAAEPGPDETALFCIGAHMSGLPLNGQLTSIGARFLRTAHTAPQYRLYAMGSRPGLLRHEEGAAIGGEIWAVPTCAIGALLALVPPPLGFGTVALEHGPCLGFLAEAAGVAGQPDITGFGGWRSWLAREDA